MQSSMQKSGFSANELLRCLGILGGTLLYSLGMNLFVVPAGLYTGGIMGLSQLLRTFLLQWTGWTLKVDIAGFINYAINLPMLLIAWKRLDHRIVLKTLLSVTSTTLFLSLVPRTDILSGDQLARCLIGGMLCGSGIGLLLWMGGTSGGMDLLGMMLIKSGSHTSIGHVNLCWNLALYTICAAAFSLSTAIYSILFSFVSTTVMDKLHMQNINVEVTVVTKILSPEMEHEILVDLHRGITRIDGIGEYTGEPGPRVLYPCLQIRNQPPARHHLQIRPPRLHRRQGRRGHLRQLQEENLTPKRSQRAIPRTLRIFLYKPSSSRYNISKPHARSLL